jgi:hypothetical protein
MKILAILIFILFSNLSYAVNELDSLKLHSEIVKYINSTHLGISESLASRSVIVVHETDSCFVFAIYFNYIELEWMEDIDDLCLASVSNNYVLLIRPSDYNKQWSFMDLIGTNTANIHAKLKAKLLRVEDLEYTTVVLPSCIVFK